MKINLQKTKGFWAYILCGFVAIIFGAMLMPLWESFENNLFFKSWGSFCVNIMISVVLIMYIALYLVKRINRYQGSPAQTVAIVELVLMVVIAVISAFTFMGIVSLGNSCQIFGVAIWVRGVSGVFTGYYIDYSIQKSSRKKAKEAKKQGASDNKSDKDDDKKENTSEKKKPDDFTVWRLTLSVFLISIGTYLFIKPPFTTTDIQWVFSGLIMLIGIILGIVGFMVKPKRIKVKKPPKTKKEKSKQKKGIDSKKDFSGTKEINAMTDTGAYEKIDEKEEPKQLNAPSTSKQEPVEKEESKQLNASVEEKENSEKSEKGQDKSDKKDKKNKNDKKEEPINQEKPTEENKAEEKPSNQWKAN